MTVNVSVSTTASSLSVPRWPAHPRLFFALALALVALVMLLLAQVATRRRKAWAVLAAGILGVALWVSCGGGNGGGGGGTQPSSYIVTVTGTSGSLSHAVAFTLTVS